MMLIISTALCRIDTAIYVNGDLIDLDWTVFIESEYPLSMSDIFTAHLTGFILPFSGISYGWTWFYYLNPLAWALQSITINEYTAKTYDFLTCITPDCSVQQR
jgi:hypothetical protein